MRVFLAVALLLSMSSFALADEVKELQFEKMYIQERQAIMQMEYEFLGKRLVEVDKKLSEITQKKEETKIEIRTPLVHLSKAQIVQEAIKLNVPLEHTWSCYKEEKDACGVCDSCRLRLNGFKIANQIDPITYKAL